MTSTIKDLPGSPLDETEQGTMVRSGFVVSATFTIYVGVAVGSFGLSLGVGHMVANG
ncbi:MULTISPECIES: hypothetical protein [unclassified Streptomyces]|uniref:hypothetical protein n=1 Tax=unclassified Streptomyces TaxID=2593676 RepID=UPI0019054F15|nr:hypothetical protein [Streptomyces sp. HSG2]